MRNPKSSHTTHTHTHRVAEVIGAQARIGGAACAGAITEGLETLLRQGWSGRQSDGGVGICIGTQREGVCV